MRPTSRNPAAKVSPIAAYLLSPASPRAATRNDKEYTIRAVVDRLLDLEVVISDR